MSLYLALKYLHVLFAITAVGFSASYGIWIWRTRGDAKTLPAILAGVRFLDSRFANPAFLVLLLSGLAMAYLAGFPLTALWIAAALILYFAVALVGILAYAPAFRALRRSADNPASPDLRSALKRSLLLNAVAGILVLLIVVLMVVKPSP